MYIDEKILNKLGLEQLKGRKEIYSYYDKEFDTLILQYSKASETYVNKKNQIYYIYNEETEELIGVEIMYYKARVGCM